MLVVLAVLSTWCVSADAHWTERAVRSAGLSSAGCTGSALVVTLSDRADLYVWAHKTRRPGLEPGMRLRVIAGVRVHLNRLRATWPADRRTVWVEAGPTTPRLPPPARWHRLVLATR